MDLRTGFTLEDPAVVVPWGIDEDGLKGALPAATEVANGYFVATVVSLEGLRHRLGFHFCPRVGGRLVEFELFRRDALGMSASFADWDRRLRTAFGPPTRSQAGDEGFPSDKWIRNGVEVEHRVFDRFGPEEHVRIRRRRGSMRATD